MFTLQDLAVKLEAASTTELRHFLSNVQADFPSITNDKYWTTVTCIAKRRGGEKNVCGDPADSKTLRCKRHRNSFIHQRKYARKVVPVVNEELSDNSDFEFRPRFK